MNKTIYVSDIDLLLRAVDFCKANGISLSKLIADALKFYLDRMEIK